MKNPLYTLLFIFIFIIFGSGCQQNNPINEGSKTDHIPFGFKQYSRNGLNFVYPENLTLNDHFTNDENFDFESNILVRSTTIDEVERHCFTEFKDRYTDTATNRPIADALEKLKEEGLKPSNYFELLKTDVLSCNGFGWQPYRALPLNVDGVNGIVAYGCAGNSGDCTPDMNWIIYTSLDDVGNVYLIVIRPIFGRLANRAFLEIKNYPDDSIAVSNATKNVFDDGFVYSQSNLTYWVEDLAANLKVMNNILETISYR